MAAAEASAPPPAEGSDAQATAAAAAVRHVLADQGSESDFLKAVALLKSAAAADKAGRGTEAALMYMAAADSVSKVQADPQEPEKKKLGLAKKMPAADKYLAAALQGTPHGVAVFHTGWCGVLGVGSEVLVLEQVRTNLSRWAAFSADGSSVVELKHQKVVSLAMHR